MDIIKVESISKKYELGQSVSLKNTILNMWRLLFKPFVSTNDRDVQKRENEFWALKDISFELKKGEILGIIGTNGSGKSTLLKILSRVTTPTKGEATIKGRVSSLLEVGTGFNPELTGRENIYLNGALLGLSRQEIESKFAEIVEFAGVEKFIDTPIKRYSSGMIVRLGFSVAAHLDSEVMIIDEVLAVGDADFQKKSLNRLKEVRRSGKSILFVSHSMELVASLCQRVMWIHLGEVMKVGDPQEVIHSYLNYHEKQRGSINRTKSSDGDGSFPFVSQLTLVNEKNEVVESVALGGDLNFIGKIKGLPTNEEKNISLYLWIENQNGLIVSEIHTDWKEEKYKASGDVNFKISVPRINLAPALYTVNVELKVNYQRSDYCLQIFNFFVVAADFYKSGIMASNRGQVYLDFDFKIMKDKEN